jgi:FkbM family methyltransferase
VSFVVDTYRKIFARKTFYGFNKRLFHLSLHGMGVMNYENHKLSGEAAFLRLVAELWERPLIIDVGANVGDYASRVKALCPDAAIYAFEPHPKTFLRLQSEASVKGYAAINAGFSDKQGRVQLYDYTGDREGSSHASLYGEVIEELHGAESQSCAIDVTTLDNFVEEHRIRKINLLKIDTEGSELRVIEGAKKTISAGLIEVIHFEFNEMNVVSRSFFRDFYKALPEYSFYRTLPDGLVPLNPYNPLMCELFAYQNIVAIHPSNRGLSEPL